jgi:nucleotide-binding universal stress UspA family protein
MNTTKPVVDPSRAARRSAPERILLASNGGPASAAALRWVIDRVGQHSAEVQFIDLVDPTAADAAQRRRNIHGMVQLLETVAPSVHASVATTDDPDELLSRSPDGIVVVGVHRGDRKPMRFAGLAVARAHGPVVVVPSEWISTRGPVMVGIGTEHDLSATLAFAEGQAAAQGAEIHMVHAWDTTGPGEIPPAWDFGTESIPERQERALSRFAQRQRESHPELTVTSEAVQGQAVARLAQAARGASLLVVGRSHRNAVMRAVFGSTAEGLVVQLPCPVAVIP